MKAKNNAASRWGERRRILVSLGISSAIVFVLIAVGKSSHPELGKPSANLPSAQIAFREFELPESRGGKVKLSDLKDNVVILHFWATWCAPCVGEIPKIIEIANTILEKSKSNPDLSRVKIVAISLDKSWTEAQTLLPNDKLPGNFISLLDLDARVSEQYGSYQYPETYFLGPELLTEQKWVGPQNWLDPGFLSLLEKRLRLPKR